MDIHKAMEEMRAEEMKNMPILSLRKIIDKLEVIKEKNKDKEDFWVRFDFGSLVPTTLHSWRGVYAELAIGYGDPKGWPKIGDVIDVFKGAIGTTYTGYKGGDFTMNESTPVWVANYGDVGNTAIVDVKDDGYQAILVTALLV